MPENEGGQALPGIVPVRYETRKGASDTSFSNNLFDSSPVFIAAFSEFVRSVRTYFAHSESASRVNVNIGPVETVDLKAHISSLTEDGWRRRLFALANGLGCFAVSPSFLHRYDSLLKSGLILSKTPVDDDTKRLSGLRDLFANFEAGFQPLEMQLVTLEEAPLRKPLESEVPEDRALGLTLAFGARRTSAEIRVLMSSELIGQLASRALKKFSRAQLRTIAFSHHFPGDERRAKLPIPRDILSKLRYFREQESLRSARQVLTEETRRKLAKKVQEILDYYRQRAIGDITTTKEGRIASKPTDEEFSGTVAERLARLDEYVAKHPEKTPSESLQQLAPEILDWAAEASRPSRQAEAPPLPKKAPELWKNRKSGETPPVFVERVYGPWLGEGLTRTFLHSADKPLYNALAKWAERHGNFGVELPKGKAETADWADRVLSGGKQENAELREARRRLRALERRSIKERE
jgi:hypothetical protein